MKSTVQGAYSMDEQETCIKPLSDLTKAIDVMPFEDFVKFIVELSKQPAENENRLPDRP
jgi:hypothetical protein